MPVIFFSASSFLPDSFAASWRVGGRLGVPRMRQSETVVKGAHACERQVRTRAGWRDCDRLHAARTEWTVSSGISAETASRRLVAKPTVSEVVTYRAPTD